MSWRLRSAPTGFIQPCQPQHAAKPPSGVGWIHEIKHDGYRMMAGRDAAGIRLLTRNGHDWASRYPLILGAVNALKCKSCLIDGETVVCDETGLAVFQKLRGRQDAHAMLYAFDLLELDGSDLRREPIEVRKATLAGLLRSNKRPGLALNEHLEGDGPTIFQHACKLGCEGIVSKRKGSLYRSGKSLDWIKTKNPASPAVQRENKEDWN